jgi:DNA-binding response OmpR family regulator
MPVSKIFVAEDNPADVYLIEQALLKHQISFELHAADNGKRALEYLREHSEGARPTLPDLILLDLNLPHHDGKELLRYVRNQARISAIPVVVLTSSGSPKDRIAAMELGANLYIRKPSGLDEFLAIGRVLGELLRQTSPGERIP